MAYLKKTTRWFAVCLLSALLSLPGSLFASELATHTLDVQLQNTTLQELFDMIEEQYNYSFLIRNNDIDLNEKVTVDTSDKSVEDILKTALKNQHADFVVNNNRIIVYKTTAKQPSPVAGTVRQAAQQESKISGVVVDAMTGEPIIGANVLVKGTTNGTITDYDGNFTLNAPVGATLAISYIGYTALEVRATAGAMNIRLAEDTKALDEVVVVGYSTQKRESLTGAMQVVSGQKLNSNTNPSVENMMMGKAPGVYVSPGEGQPGQVGKIVIRGKATVSGNTDPLWVVDGVIIGSSAGDLNPADIASMSILKDAASTAIYGSQGANGVIVVTTKKGQSGKATVNVSAKLGVSQLSQGKLSMMNGSELYDYFQSFPNQEDIKFNRYTADLRNDNYDWFKENTRLGFTQDYNISLSGGSEKMRTYLSLGYYNEEGAVKDFDFSRYSFRFNVDYQVTDWLKIRPQVSGSRKDLLDQQFGVGNFYSLLPWDSPYDEEGNLVGNRPAGWVKSTGNNQLYDLQWDFNKGLAYEFMGNFDFDINLTKWLSFTSVNSYRYNTWERKEYLDPQSKDGAGTLGSLSDYNSRTYRIYSNQLLKFNKDFGKHSVNALLGYEWNSINTTTNLGVANGFGSGFEVANAAAVPRSVEGGRTERAVQSVFFNANYAYDYKYLLQFSVRRDGASNFGEDAKYGNFYSISGGWNIHREDFFNLDYVNQLKLRASYGSVGTPPTEPYPQYFMYKVENYNELSGGMIEQVKNDNLTWEKTFTTGLGLDVMLFNRLTVTLDYYNKKTSNLLYKVPVPAVSGVKEIWQNIGIVRNQGFEATVSVDILRDLKDWDWSVDANIGINRNQVKELYGAESEIIAPTGSGWVDNANKLLKPGYDIDTWYLTEWAGVDPQTGQPQWYTTNENGERVITNSYGEASKHKTICGRYSPDFFGGFSTNLRYKQFDLGAVFTYSVGGEIYNYMRIEYDSDGAYVDRNQMNLKKGWTRWEKPGDIATHPQAVYQNKSDSNKGSSRHLEDGSYLKMKALTIGYNFSLPQYSISNIRLYFTGENLFTITGFSGIDPELPPNVTDRRLNESKVSGVANSVYPQTRKFMFGLNLTF